MQKLKKFAEAAENVDSENECSNGICEEVQKMQHAEKYLRNMFESLTPDEKSKILARLKR